MDVRGYVFPKRLMEGLILSRPNRFIMVVQLGNQVVKAHCPSTGRIGNIVFRDIPCLVSEADGAARKTRYTVEAISLDAPQARRKRWRGINQVRSNAIVEHFLRAGALGAMMGKGAVREPIRREVRLGNSRIDFQVGEHYLEVKTPLNLMQVSRVATQAPTAFDSFERIIKHFGDLARSLRGNSRAILAMCYFYDAPRFVPPPTDKHNAAIKRAVAAAQRKGLENWQINFVLDAKGVQLGKCFKLSLF